MRCTEAGDAAAEDSHGLRHGVNSKWNRPRLNVRRRTLLTAGVVSNDIPFRPDRGRIGDTAAVHLPSGDGVPFDDIIVGWRGTFSPTSEVDACRQEIRL